MTWERNDNAYPLLSFFSGVIFLRGRERARRAEVSLVLLLLYFGSFTSFRVNVVLSAMSTNSSLNSEPVERLSTFRHTKHADG